MKILKNSIVLKYVYCAIPYKIIIVEQAEDILHHHHSLLQYNLWSWMIYNNLHHHILQQGNTNYHHVPL
eukprot:UN07475